MQSEVTRGHLSLSGLFHFVQRGQVQNYKKKSLEKCECYQEALDIQKEAITNVIAPILPQ